ncbi:MAG: hypothetical protein DBY02_10090 [Coprobacter fastidiosus]|nr:MAG: hypothetical protein DBY02_10090 [Coprobacter fastidiosus]
MEHDTDNRLARLGSYRLSCSFNSSVGIELAQAAVARRAVAVEVVAHLQVCSSVLGYSLCPAALQARGCEGDVAVLLELLARKGLGVHHAIIRYRQGDAGLRDDGRGWQGVEGGGAVVLAGKGDGGFCIPRQKLVTPKIADVFHPQYGQFLSFAHPGKGHAPLRVLVEAERDGGHAAFVHLVAARSGVGDIAVLDT